MRGYRRKSKKKMRNKAKV